MGILRAIFLSCTRAMYCQKLFLSDCAELSVCEACHICSSHLSHSNNFTDLLSVCCLIEDVHTCILCLMIAIA